MSKIIRNRKNKKEISYFESIGTSKKDGYKFAHMIESDENEYEITAKIIIPKTSSMIEKFKKTNKSPIRQIIEKIEKDSNTRIKEEKTDMNIYELYAINRDDYIFEKNA